MLSQLIEAAQLNGIPLGRTQPVTDGRSLIFSVSPAACAPSRTSERINRGANGRGARRDLLNRGGTRTHTSVGGMRRGLGNAGCRAPVMQTNAGGACLVGAARALSRTIERIDRGANGRGARRGLIHRGGTRTHASAGGMRPGLGNASCRAPVVQTNAGGACQVGWATSCGQARLSVLTSHAPTGACS